MTQAVLIAGGAGYAGAHMQGAGPRGFSSHRTGQFVDRPS
jgi:hypothetical protein